MIHAVDRCPREREDHAKDMDATILIADDDGVSRKLLRRLLEQDGHTVRTASNGREALELFREEPSDVVLLDIVMPELDGISVLEQLKATPGTEHVPVIMISAVDETDSVVRCIEKGADDFLPNRSTRHPARANQRRTREEAASRPGARARPRRLLTLSPRACCRGCPREPTTTCVSGE